MLYYLHSMYFINVSQDSVKLNDYDRLLQSSMIQIETITTG